MKQILLLITLLAIAASAKHYRDGGTHICPGIGVHGAGQLPDKSSKVGGHFRLWFNETVGLNFKGYIGYDRKSAGGIAELLLKPRIKGAPVRPYLLGGVGFHQENFDTTFSRQPFAKDLRFLFMEAGAGLEARLGEREKHGIGLEAAYTKGEADYYHSASPIGSTDITKTRHTFTMPTFSATLLYTFYLCKPEPEDSDGDGLWDHEDQCPTRPEDKDHYKDEDGCPEWDNDMDGIADTVDRCPFDREDPDSFEDQDGCPEFDNDKDGIADSVDICPMIPEDRDGFEDTDGCPELDNDGDGFVDSLDQCPLEPETRNNYRDNDGCPDERPVVKEITREPMVLDGVTFESGKAVLKPSSFATLDKVAESLVAWLEVSIEIQGHTDAIGSAEQNRELSLSRAMAVKDYLVSRGVDQQRLRTVGYGEELPIASNRTSAGRAENRRVELHRID